MPTTTPPRTGATLAVVLSVPGYAPRRLTFDRPEIKVGSDRDNDIVLRVAERWHAQVFYANGEITIADLRGNGTFLNGQPIAELTRLGQHDEVRIGDARLTFAIERASTDPDDHPTGEWNVDVTPVFDKVEGRLLDALAEDPASSEVYADWLEQRGDRVRAELLRVRDAYRASHDGKTRARLRGRLRKLAAVISFVWVARVAPEFEDDHTLEWDLEPPTDPGR